MFNLLFGDVGSGKSLSQAKTCLDLLLESRWIEKKYKLPKREVWNNEPMNKEINEKYKDRLKTWKNPLEMIFKDYPNNKIIRRDFDCLWDEIAVEIPSDKWKDTDPEIRRFFAQHRKRGVRIYANTQDYMMVDINARRMVTEVQQIHKVFGSRDPSPTLPPIKLIWGFCFLWKLDKKLIRQDDQKRKKMDMFPKILWITKKLTKAYDTGHDVERDEKLWFKHQLKKCPTCGFEKVIHT